MKKIIFIFISLLLIADTINAQHEEHPQESNEHQDMPDSMQAPMSHAFSLSLPMTRNGSGTGWLPDLSPMYGYMVHGDQWMYMFHGNVFVRYNSQDITNKGSRGDSKVDAPNWFMAMGQRKVGERGLLRFSSMFSLDPLFGGEGYPLLFQTGETFQGKPLVDRQHPHNLFSELSIAYTHLFSEDADAFVYLAYPGEPALGPVAFMHRPSSQNNLDSPLGHHWQDATHITFGVATLGFRYKVFKLEGSVFTGREPGEARYGFDKPRFDSYSYRLSANPHPQLALQFSQAFLKSPEPIDPDKDVWRSTASVLHAFPLKPGNYNLTSGLIWGYNDAGEDHTEHSITLESNLQLNRFGVYGRYEWIQKSAEELQVEVVEEDHHLFKINTLTIGSSYIFLKALNTNLAVGVQGSIYMAESTLDEVYGNNPLAGQVYLRIYPQLMQIPGISKKHMHDMHH
ncbi:hypothetical protein [Catalinimonas niigatensis]|uniref:hypothetical protein n=1 Tax=Catalinimonas niigatensis TaxID=1397264 RepID=UPI0026653DA3|nr:hypothetical protein [Catalinimonas niigatensis]WPP52020.1 hypothetical protein PZB72_06445 [Catalinimonas niigatensis]